MATPTTQQSEISAPSQNVDHQNGPSTASVPKPDCRLESHYNDLLKVIEDIGRDVKPSYTNNKVSTDRLKKNIMMARSVLRDCMSDLEKLTSN